MGDADQASVAAELAFDERVKRAFDAEKDPPPPDDRRRKPKEAKKRRTRDPDPVPPGAVPEDVPRKKPKAPSEEKEKSWKTLQRYAELFPTVVAIDGSRTIDDYSEEQLAAKILECQKAVNRMNDKTMLGHAFVSGCKVIEIGAVTLSGNRIKLLGFTDEIEKNLESFDTCLKQLSIKYSLDGMFPPEVVLVYGLLRIARLIHCRNVKREMLESMSTFSGAPVKDEAPHVPGPGEPSPADGDVPV